MSIISSGSDRGSRYGPNCVRGPAESTENHAPDEAPQVKGANRVDISPKGRELSESPVDQADRTSESLRAVIRHRIERCFYDERAVAESVACRLLLSDDLKIGA